MKRLTLLACLLAACGSGVRQRPVAETAALRKMKPSGPGSLIALSFPSQKRGTGQLVVRCAAGKCESETVSVAVVPSKTKRRFQLLLAGPTGLDGKPWTAEVAASLRFEDRLLRVQGVDVSALTGAHVEAPPSTLYRQCHGPAGCPAGSICLAGYCQDDQSGSSCGGGDSPCPFGYLCIAATCEPPPDLSSCDPTNPDSCSPGQSCHCNVASGGQCACVNLCDPLCPANTTCNSATHTCDPNPAGYPDIAGVWTVRQL